MNSIQRHAARRARRDARRAANKAKRNEGLTLAAAMSPDSMYAAARAASCGVRWKASVQRYMLDCLRRNLKSSRDVLAGRDTRLGLTHFDVNERGKVRHISAPRFSERVIQKSVARNVLVPAIGPTLTPGCAANFPGRGTDYALIRLKRQLAVHFRRHGPDGYIALMDFSNYFGSVDHAAAKRLLGRALCDPAAIEYLGGQIDYEPGPGIGLGSEPNQCVAVALPTPLDHLAEGFPGIEASGRYMDDSYAIAMDKETLWAYLAEADALLSSLGISINPRKTQVVKLSRGFTFLKKRFRYSETGRIVVTPDKRSLSRERRRLKKHARLVAMGEMTVEQARTSYMSWRGSIERSRGDGRVKFRMNAHRTARSFDVLFEELFGVEPRKETK